MITRSASQQIEATMDRLVWGVYAFNLGVLVAFALAGWRIARILDYPL